MVYRHLLVNQERTTLDAIMAEADKDGEKGGGGGGRSSPLSAASAGDGGNGGGGDTAKKKKMNDTDYRKLMNLLLQLRSVFSSCRRFAGRRGREGGGVTRVLHA